jgi:serine/threonine-protein kinase
MYCRVDGFATVGRSRFPGEDPSLREGETVVGRYRLDQVIGSGPLGVAYRATDLRLGAPLLVRILPGGLSADLRLVARFQREGRLVASLAHPNIVRVAEHGVSEDGTLFVAQELVLGPTLAEVLTKEGPLEPRRVVAIGRELFDALVEAHTHGVLHRSLGLENVLLHRRPDGGEMVKVSHFGLARVLADDEAEPFVWPSSLVAAWRTMAPEQARGRGVSGHADLYSVGAILYELLTGRSVFSESSPSDLLVAHSVKIPHAPEREGRMLVGPLIDVIMRCLEKKPWNRPDGAQKALDQLEAARNHPLLVSPTPTAEFGAPAPDAARSGPQSGRPTNDPTRPNVEPVPVASPITQQHKRATNPYGVKPPSPSQPVPVAYPASRPLVRPTVEREQSPPEPRSRRVTQPSAVGPGAPLSQGGVSPRTGRDSRMERSLSYGVQVGARPDTANSSSEASDPELIIRGGPSPFVAFVLGLLVAGALGGLGYFLIFGGSGAKTTDATAETLAQDTPVEPVASAAPVPVNTLADPPIATSATTDATQDVAVAAAPAPDAALPEAQAPDAAVAVAPVAAPAAVDAASAPVANAATDTATLVAPPGPAPTDAKRIPVPSAPFHTAIARKDPPRTDKPDKPEPPRKAPVDPLADLEDPDFVARPTPPSLRKVLVDSDPVGAKVAVRGQIIGETPIYVEWEEDSSGVDIVVSKVGFQPVRTRLSAGVGRAVRLSLKSSL